MSMEWTIDKPAVAWDGKRVEVMLSNGRVSFGAAVFLTHGRLWRRRRFSGWLVDHDPLRTAWPEVVAWRELQEHKLR
jgi:hypothetical protein